jgi:hypothetical protein
MLHVHLQLSILVGLKSNSCENDLTFAVSLPGMEEAPIVAAGDLPESSRRSRTKSNYSVIGIFHCS